MITKLQVKNTLLKGTLLLIFYFGLLSVNAQIVISEFKAPGSVELKNLGTETVDISSYWLCDFPSYRRLSDNSITVENGSLMLAPNAIVEVSGFNFISGNDGELGLYLDNSFSSSASIVDYVQWGSVNHRRAEVAVQAGTWTANNFIPAFNEGNSIQYDGIGNRAIDYFEATPTLNQENCNVTAGEITINTTNLSPTTSVSEDLKSAVICLSDSPDLISVDIAPGGIGPNRGFIITDNATDVILALPSDGPFDLSGAGPGVCDIWYVRYEDSFNGNVVGNSLADLSGCFDLSEPVTITREAADAGTIGIDVEATNAQSNTTLRIDGEFEASICVDGRVDNLVVFHETPSVNLSYLYVITDATSDDDTILAIVNSPVINLDGAGVGVCDIWGWSYRGLNNDDFIGQPLQSLRDADCSDISEDRIRVTREAADAGTIGIDVDATNAQGNSTLRIDGEFEASICVDGVADNLVVFHETPSVNLSYLYVITDATSDDDTILAIVNSPVINLDGAGVGVCDIWGWSYRGLNNDDFIGQPLQSLRDADCSDISEDRIRVTREAADAGKIGIDVEATNAQSNTTLRIDGELEASICVDGRADNLVVFHETPSVNLSYLYVITDATSDDDTILAIVNSPVINLDGAGVGVCDIWGWSYRGLNNDDFIGQPLQSLRDADCSDISEDRIRVTREAADAGTIGIDVDATNAQGNSTLRIDGEFEASICVDGVADNLVVFHETPSVNLSYLYVITDATSDDDTILAIVNSPVINLDGAGVGVCDIWGWSYRGLNNDDFIGQPLQSLRDADCSDISEDRIRVTREAADAGTIGIDVEATNAQSNSTLRIDGELEASICVDGRADNLVVFHETPSVNLSYLYVITDATSDDDTILAIVNSPVINLDGAGVGVCDIWGWSYRGLNNDDFIGQPLQSLRDADCSDISEDRIRVTREAADAGTIGIDVEATNAQSNTTLRIDGELEASICVDGRADNLVVFHETPSVNLSYLYVITDATSDDDTILAIVNSPVINLDGAGVGVCDIWGWSYRGLNNDDFIGQPLQSLRDADCSDISEDRIRVTREAADAGTIGIDVDATNAQGNSTLRIDGELEASICVDGRADNLVVFHETPSVNLSYLYVITDATSDDDTILAIVNSPVINLDGAGVGVCDIWGWSYRGLNNDDFIGQPLQSLRDADCSDISEDRIRVTREAADAGTIGIDLAATNALENSSLRIDGEFEATICVDGEADNLVVFHETPSVNLTYLYVITDATSNNDNILAITGDPNINLDGAGVGVCDIWGWSYRGLNLNDFIGQPLQSLRDAECSDISEDRVRVTRLSGADCDVLSTESFQEEASFSVYPNPASNVINLTTSNLTSFDTVTVEVYNLVGKLVMRRKLNSANESIDVSNLSNGLYLVNLIDSNKGLLANRKILKN